MILHDALRTKRSARAWLRTSQLAPVLAMLLVFYLTNRWLSWSAGVDHVSASDVAAYLQMSEAAPGLPSGDIGSAYTDRFVVHWSIGTVAHLTGVRLTVVYQVLWLIVSLAVIMAVVAVLRALGTRGPALWLCTALLVLNPYAFRYYALVPGMQADLVFELGLATALLGLVRRWYAVLLGGLVLAVLARQTALVVAPVLAVSFALCWRPRPSGQVLPRAALLVVVPLGAYLAVRQVTAGFTETFAPRIPQDTILPLLTDLRASRQLLVEHAARVFAPVAVLSAVLGTAMFLRWRAGRGVPTGTWLALAVGAAVIAQPLGIGPSFPGFEGNQSRLSALGVVPLVVSVGAALTGLEPLRSHRATLALLGMPAVVALASLHPAFTVIGPESSGQFMAVQVAAAASAALLLAFGWDVRVASLPRTPAATPAVETSSGGRGRWSGRARVGAGRPEVGGLPASPASCRRSGDDGRGAPP